MAKTGTSSGANATLAEAQAKTRKAFRDSQANSRWAPPNGEYQVILAAANKTPEVKVFKDKNTKTKNYQISQRITLKLVGGEFDDREFNHTFRSKSDKPSAGDWKALAALLGQEDTDTSDETTLAATVHAGIGTQLTINVTHSEFNNRDYVFIDFMDVEGGTDVEDDDEEEDEVPAKKKTKGKSKPAPVEDEDDDEDESDDEDSDDEDESDEDDESDDEDDDEDDEEDDESDDEDEDADEDEEDEEPAPRKTSKKKTPAKPAKKTSKRR